MPEENRSQPHTRTIGVTSLPTNKPLIKTLYGHTWSYAKRAPLPLHKLCRASVDTSSE